MTAFADIPSFVLCFFTPAWAPTKVFTCRCRCSSLSGFLITAILLDDSERAGRLDLVRFGARRLRRITPAALAGVVLAIIFGATIATRSQAEQLVGDLIGVVFYVVNWTFIVTEQSYIDVFSPPPQFSIIGRSLSRSSFTR